MSVWLGDTESAGTWLDMGIDRARDTARRIAQKPTTITVVRSGVTAWTETVRLEAYQNPIERTNPTNTTSKQKVLVIGYKGHPAIDDTDLQRGDRFKVGEQLFEVIDEAVGLTDRLIMYAEAQP